MTKKSASTPKGSTSTLYPTYPPEIEARRSDYEQIARAFNLLIEVSDRPGGGNRLDIDLPYSADVARRADLLDTIQGHLYRLHLDINWYDPETMLFLYTEMRMQADLWRWQQQQDRPDDPPVNPAAPRGITALYVQLGALMSEVMDHEDCATAVSDALGSAFLELRDRYDGHIPTGLKDDFVGLAQKASAAKRGQQ